jgi:fanconi-associated nuclease 1
VRVQVIFASVDDVFLSPFQDGPIDLDFSSCFYANRRELIHARLTAIATMDDKALIAAVRRSYVANFGRICRGVSWSIPLQFLQLVAVCVSGPTLAHIFYNLCRNQKHFSGGMPDLFLWRILAPGAAMLAAPPASSETSATVEVVDVSWSQDSCEHVVASLTRHPATSASNDKIQDLQLIPGARYEAMCVEVKGPRDRLSDKQRAWIHIMTDGGFPVDVCYVKETSGGGVARSNTA